MDLLIFDLDGTLIDSKLDIANAVNATRSHMRMSALDIEQISKYVGNGAPVLIRRALGEGATEPQIQEALEFFLEYYREHSLDCTQLYPGVKPTLERLQSAGKKLGVLTNKPIAASRDIVAGLDLARHFFRIYGGNSFDFKKPHPIGVERLMDEAGVSREQTLMVGDSSVDVLTARNAGVRSCGVTYGFAPATLADPTPDLLVDHLEQLADWVLQGSTPLR